jgi:hypothetical protein
MERFESGMQMRMERALQDEALGFQQRLEMLVEAALMHHFEQQAVSLILEDEEIRLGRAAAPVLAAAESQMSAFIRRFVRMHSGRDDDEVERVAHRMEIVGRALVDDALRRSDRSATLAADIATVVAACAAPGFWNGGDR